MMQGELLMRQHGPSKQGVEFDGDGCVADVSYNAVVPSAQSLNHNDPLTQPRVDHVSGWQRGTLRCCDLKLLCVNLKLESNVS